jgi:hypothetical protein
MANFQKEAIRRRLQRKPIHSLGGHNIGKPHFRRGRNSIPRVNPNPRPPNEPKNKSKDKGINNQAKGNTTGQSSGTGPVSNQFTNLMPQPGVPDPRDEQYWRDVAVLMNNRNTSLSGLDIESTYAKSDYDQRLEELSRQQPRDIQNLRENANDAGAFYSSRTGENIGRLEQDYFTTRSGLERDFNQSSSLRDLERRGLESGYELDSQQALADAIARRAGLVSEDEPPYVDPISSTLAQLLNKSKSKPKSKSGSSIKRPPKPGPNFVWSAKKGRWIKK